jgi:twitching motility protein PilT
VQFLPRPRPEGGFDVTFTNALEPPPLAVQSPLGAAHIVREAAPNYAAEEMAHTETPRAKSPSPSAALEALLAEAVALRASDVHVREGEPAFARVDGRLVPLSGGPHDMRMLIGEALGAERQSADVSLASPSAGRVRLHAFRVGRAVAIALRVLPPAIPTLASLGFPVDLSDLALLPNGLVLVTGPTGSGKSTTAAALCQEVLRQRSAVLLTLEDPVEYAFDTSGTRSLVRQRQIGVDVADFSTGLRDALREDPDVLLIGEMRDAESISLALTAAETGHLVFASLHSRSAASAIERIVDTYPAARQHQLRIQLSESLRAVIAQRLLPRAQGGGRVAALEVLRKNSAVANLIREGKTPQLVNVMQSSRREGMLPLERNLATANDQEALSEYLQARSKP